MGRYFRSSRNILGPGLQTRTLGQYLSLVKPRTGELGKPFSSVPVSPEDPSLTLGLLACPVPKASSKELASRLAIPTPAPQDAPGHLGSRRRLAAAWDLLRGVGAGRILLLLFASHRMIRTCGGFQNVATWLDGRSLGGDAVL